MVSINVYIREKYDNNEGEVNAWESQMMWRFYWSDFLLGGVEVSAVMA